MDQQCDRFDALYELFLRVQKADEQIIALGEKLIRPVVAIPRHLWEDVREALEKCK